MALAGVVVGATLTGGFSMYTQTRSSRRAQREKYFDDLITRARRVSPNAQMVLEINSMLRRDAQDPELPEASRGKLIDQRAEFKLAFTVNVAAWRLHGPQSTQVEAGELASAITQLTRSGLTDEEFSLSVEQVINAAAAFDRAWLAYRNKHARDLFVVGE